MIYKQHIRKCVIILFSFLLVSILYSAFFHMVSADAMLESGFIVRTKMKALTANPAPDHEGEPYLIRAIRMADSLPDNFIPSEVNIVSTPQSNKPIYAFFDNEDNAGIMYFYTEDNRIKMNPYSGYMFANNDALIDISGLTDWNTSEVLDFGGLFSNARNLQDISAIKNWDTSKVLNMSRLLGGAEKITDINALSNWDTTNVKNMFGLLSGAKSLPDALALRNWNTSNVENMSYMFADAESLMFVDVSNWNTGKVTDMTCMFQVGQSYKGNGQLVEINGLGNLDVSNVTDMTCMFYGAGQMTYYDVSDWDVSKVESMNHMFCDNYKLVSLDLSNWDVSSVKTMYCMFDDCQALKTIGDVSHWNTVSLIDAGAWINDARSFVGNNEGLLDLSGWNTTNLKAAGEMFLNTKIHTIDLSGWSFDSITNDTWEEWGHGIFYEIGNSSEILRGFGQMFKGTKDLTTVYVSQSGLDSFNAAVEREVNTLDMWTDSKSDGFTVK